MSTVWHHTRDAPSFEKKDDGWLISIAYYEDMSSKKSRAKQKSTRNVEFRAKFGVSGWYRSQAEAKKDSKRFREIVDTDFGGISQSLLVSADLEEDQEQNTSINRGKKRAIIAYDPRPPRRSPRRRKTARIDTCAGRSWTGAFNFVQLADCQYGMLKGDRSWDEEREMLHLAITHINRLRPRFVCVCGDLINAWPLKENQKVRAEQTADLKKSFDRIDADIPLVCVCGNHDIGNRPSNQTIKAYKRDWGDDYCSFWISGIAFIVINSQMYIDDTDCKESAQKQDEWLQEKLDEAKRDAKYAVVFSHVPPFIESADEEDGWANIPIVARRQLLQRMKDSGVRFWFCGHYHQNAVSRDGPLEVVVTAAVGTVFDSGGRNTNGPRPNFDVVKQMVAAPNHSGLRVVQVQETGLHHEFHTLDSIPANALEVATGGRGEGGRSPGKTKQKSSL